MTGAQTRSDDIDDVDEQLELYALNLLDDAEIAEVERHLRDDPAARDRVAVLRGVAATLAYDLEPIAPSADLKFRILDAARADLDTDVPASAPAPAMRAEPSARVTSISEARERRGRSGWAAWAVAAVLALALVGNLGWNLRLRDQLDERTAELAAVSHPVSGTSAAANVHGSVLVVGDDGTALLSLGGLDKPAPGTVFQVWLIAEGAPVPNVTFVPNDQGFASVAVPGNVESYKLLAITVEPDGGSPAPTTEPIISSDLTTSSSSTS